MTLTERAEELSDILHPRPWPNSKLSTDLVLNEARQQVAATIDLIGWDPGDWDRMARYRS